MTIEGIILLFGSLLALIAAFLFYHYYHFRFVSFVRNEHTVDMDFASLEGYTDKYYYLPGETVTFYLHSEHIRNALILRRMNAPYQFEEIIVKEFSSVIQDRSDTASEYGCKWKPVLTITLEKNVKSGYYQALLNEAETGKEYPIYFIIGSLDKTAIAVIAPVSTWTAYNPYGGESLYQNNFEAKTVYNVSSQRPNNAFQLNHDIQVEANAFNWFSKQYKSVNIIPDYYLESEHVLDKCKILVLVYHCEYISRQMYDSTRKFLTAGGSMISLGANQYYWVIRWHGEYGRMECRKDLTFFEDSFEYGGMWKHHFRHPNNLFGEHYTPPGMHTFAPYVVRNAEHWLFEESNVKNGDLFGMQGINELGISGAETDKAKKNADIEIIAHGMNCDTEETGKNYNSSDPKWNGDGGGDIIFKKLSDKNAILSFGSIQSPSGLGTDPVFTAIVKNFIRKYLPAL
jgi:N,N-dimethylformamidase